MARCPHGNSVLQNTSAVVKSRSTAAQTQHEASLTKTSSFQGCQVCIQQQHGFRCDDKNQPIQPEQSSMYSLHCSTTNHQLQAQPVRSTQTNPVAARRGCCRCHMTLAVPTAASSCHSRHSPGFPRSSSGLLYVCCMSLNACHGCAWQQLGCKCVPVHCHAPAMQWQLLQQLPPPWPAASCVQISQAGRAGQKVSTVLFTARARQHMSAPLCRD